MRIEDKAQVKAIKKGNCIAGKVGNTIMLSEGHYIAYIPEKQCMLDISRMKQFPEDALIKYSPEEVEKQMKPIELTKKALILTGKMVQLFENEETGTRVWIDSRYLKMFRGHSYYSVEIGEDTSIAFCSYGRIVGLVLQFIVNEE